jgi:AraC-like DNA-binding protein
MMVSVTVYDMSRIFVGFSGPLLTESLLALFGTFLICAVSFKGLMHPAIFFGKGRNQGDRTFNSYRMARVRKLLIDNPDMSVIEAAFICGFNSKFTFNDAFKRDTGLTPSEYRRLPGVN